MGLMGSLFFVGFFRQMFQQARGGKIMERICAWGQQTLGIYILQTVILETFLARALSFDSMPLPLFYFVVSPLISFAVLVVCVLLIHFICRWPVFAFLFFGKPMKNAWK